MRRLCLVPVVVGVASALSSCRRARLRPDRSIARGATMDATARAASTGRPPAPDYDYDLECAVALSRGEAPPPRRPSPEVPPAPRRPAWPPEGADDAKLWTSRSCGPLGPAADAFFERTFRAALASEVGGDGAAAGFAGVVELARRLAAAPPRSAAATERRALSVLRSCFPDWPPAPAAAAAPGLLHWFTILFARPFPEFSAKLNARVTFLCGQWLMGPLSLRDLDGDDPERGAGDGAAQLVRVERCRFLEESACASVCVNACKMPTEALFNRDMGVPVTITPDYDTLTCDFKFGVAPTRDDEDRARATPCFAACPSAGVLREPLCPDMGPGDRVSS